METNSKSTSPYYAQINFTIDVFRVKQDGSLDPNKLTKSELEAYNISSSAAFGVDGFNLDDCIHKLKQVLGGLKYVE